MPAELIEAELSGLEAGGDTGACSRAKASSRRRMAGRCSSIDRQPAPWLANEVLRVLETGKFQRPGSNRERQVKVRILSATNADLPAMIRAARFARTSCIA